jgi:hypothetical protein
MIRHIRPFGTTVMMVGLAAAVLAQGPTPAPKVNIKMGLWEMTTTMQMSGVATPDTSKMTPDQQAQMQAMMGAMMGPQTHTTQTCMTKEKFDKAQFDDNQGCTRSITTNTASVLEMEVTCKNAQGTSKGTMHMEAPSPDSIKGTMTGESGMRGQTMKMSGTMTGKWLGADCGKVK